MRFSGLGLMFLCSKFYDVFATILKRLAIKNIIVAKSVHMFCKGRVVFTEGNKRMT